MRKFMFDKRAFDGIAGADDTGPQPKPTPPMSDALLPPGSNRMVTKSPQAQQEEAMMDQVQDQAGDIGEPNLNPVLEDANAMASGMPLPSESPEGYQANVEAQQAQDEAAQAGQEAGPATDAGAGAPPSASLAPPAPAAAGPMPGRKTIIEKKTIIEPGLPAQTTEAVQQAPAPAAAPSAALKPPAHHAPPPHHAPAKKPEGAGEEKAAAPLPPEIMQIIAPALAGGAKKEDVLEMLGGLRGMLPPALHQQVMDGANQLFGGQPPAPGGQTGLLDHAQQVAGDARHHQNELEAMVSAPPSTHLMPPAPEPMHMPKAPPNAGQQASEFMQKHPVKGALLEGGIRGGIGAGFGALLGGETDEETGKKTHRGVGAARGAAAGLGSLAGDHVVDRGMKALGHAATKKPGGLAGRAAHFLAEHPHGAAGIGAAGAGLGALLGYEAMKKTGPKYDHEVWDKDAANDARMQIDPVAMERSRGASSYPLETEYENLKNASAFARGFIKAASEVTDLKWLMRQHEERETPEQEAKESTKEQELERREGVETHEKSAFLRGFGWSSR